MARREAKEQIDMVTTQEFTDDALGISAPGEEDDDIAERLRAAGRSDRSSTIPPKMRFEGVVIKFR